MTRPTEIGDAARWHDKLFHTDVHENDVVRSNLGWDRDRDRTSVVLHTVMSLSEGDTWWKFSFLYVCLYFKINLDNTKSTTFKVSLYMRCQEYDRDSEWNYPTLNNFHTNKSTIALGVCMYQMYSSYLRKNKWANEFINKEGKHFSSGHTNPRNYFTR